MTGVRFGIFHARSTGVYLRKERKEGQAKVVLIECAEFLPTSFAFLSLRALREMNSFFSQQF